MRITRVLGVLVIVLGIAAVAIVMAPMAKAQWDAHRPDVHADWMPFNRRLAPGSSIGAMVEDLDQSRPKGGPSEGAVVEGVSPESPAAKAGLQKSDVIVEFDGEKVRGARQLIRLVRETPPGRTVRMAVDRAGQRVNLDISPTADGPGSMAWRFDGLNDSIRDLAQFGRDFHLDMRDFDGPMFRRSRLGITVEALTPQLASYFGVKAGVLVSSVREDSPAGAAGLMAGDVITAVDQQPTSSPEDLMRILREADEEREVSIELTRNHRSMTLKSALEAPTAGHGRRIKFRTAA